MVFKIFYRSGNGVQTGGSRVVFNRCIGDKAKKARMRREKRNYVQNESRHDRQAALTTKREVFGHRGDLDRGERHMRNNKS